ncbi:MAG: hypothetical protein ACOCVF_02825 [bacterium]
MAGEQKQAYNPKTKVWVLYQKQKDGRTRIVQTNKTRFPGIPVNRK